MITCVEIGKLYTVGPSVYPKAVVIPLEYSRGDLRGVDIRLSVVEPKRCYSAESDEGIHLSKAAGLSRPQNVWILKIYDSPDRAITGYTVAVSEPSAFNSFDDIVDVRKINEMLRLHAEYDETRASF